MSTLHRLRILYGDPANERCTIDIVHESLIVALAEANQLIAGGRLLAMVGSWVRGTK
jgi:hypothetical protein